MGTFLIYFALCIVTCVAVLNLFGVIPRSRKEFRNLSSGLRNLFGAFIRGIKKDQKEVESEEEKKFKLNQIIKKEFLLWLDLQIKSFESYPECASMGETYKMIRAVSLSATYKEMEAILESASENYGIPDDGWREAKGELVRLKAKYEKI